MKGRICQKKKTTTKKWVLKVAGLSRQEGNECVFKKILPLHLCGVNNFQLDLHMCSILTHYTLFPLQGLCLSLCLFKYAGHVSHSMQERPHQRSCSHLPPFKAVRVPHTTWQRSFLCEVFLLPLFFCFSIGLIILVGHAHISNFSSHFIFSHETAL